MAIQSVGSIRNSNPDAEVVLVGSPIVIEHLRKSYDDVFPIEGMADVPYPYRRTMANYAFNEPGGEYCFADVDTLFLKNIKPVFNHTFQVAPTIRCPQVPELPRYNWGVCFSRGETEFWKDVVVSGYDRNRTKQAMDIEYLATALVRKYPHHELEGKEYNHIVDGLGKTFNNEVSILHFKGQRQRFMKSYYERLILNA